MHISQGQSRRSHLDRPDTLTVAVKFNQGKNSPSMRNHPGEATSTKYLPCRESSLTDSSVRNPEYITGFEAQKEDIYS